MADGSITVEVSTQAAQAELERLRAENAALKLDLQYARDGLAKGRTRMREDNERLREALREVLQSNVGQQTLAQLADGQGTATEEGKAWLAAAALVLGPNVEVKAAGRRPVAP